MSKLGDKLKLLVERNGGNKYRFSKDAGIDRATLYHVINGERMPSKDFLDKICSALRISSTDEKELRELYEIAVIGEDVHERRLLVKSLVNHINSLRLEQRPAHGCKAIKIEGIDDTVKVVSGSYNVNTLVRNMLDDLAYNAPYKRLWINAPFEFSFLFDHLRQLYFELNGTIEIEHMVAFAKDAGGHRNPNINLLILADVLAFVFCEGQGYHAQYYYPDSMNCDSAFMPYYLLTEKRLLMLSSDSKTAMLINDSGAIQACRAQFDATRTKPLFNFFTSPVNMLEAYLSIWNQNDVPDILSVEAQPCLMEYHLDNTAELYIRKELPDRDILKQTLTQLIKNVRNSRVHTFFTVDGLEAYSNNGYVYPPQFTLPLNMSDRLLHLKSLRKDVANDRNNSRVVNISEISVSPNTTVQIYINSSMLFSIVSETGMRLCLINEPSIHEAFRDFFYSLHNTEWVYTKQETLEILDKYIEKIKKCGDNKIETLS